MPRSVPLKQDDHPSSMRAYGSLEFGPNDDLVVHCHAVLHAVLFMGIYAHRKVLAAALRLTCATAAWAASLYPIAVMITRLMTPIACAIMYEATDHISL